MSQPPLDRDHPVAAVTRPPAAVPPRLLDAVPVLRQVTAFVEDLRRLRPEIAARLAEAGALGADAFLRVAVAAADLPPVLEGVVLHAQLARKGWYEKFPPATIGWRAGTW